MSANNIIVSMTNPLVSICTSTYNRAHTLDIPYQSLCKQTYKNIEWIIVDGGSNDNTDDMVASFQKNASFPIYYLKLERSGKHIALNHLFSMAKGEYFIELDSDDELLSDAVERAVDIWDKIPNRNEYWTISGSCIDDNLQYVGCHYPEDINSKTLLRQKKIVWEIPGERIHIRRTEILKKYRFPDISGIRYITEGYIWKQIDSKYKRWCTNDIFRIYHSSADSLSSISENTLSDSNETIYTLYVNYLLLINDIFGEYDSVISKQFIFSSIMLWKYIFYLEKSPYFEIMRVNSITKKILFTLTYMPAYIYYSWIH